MQSAPILCQPPGIATRAPDVAISRDLPAHLPPGKHGLSEVRESASGYLWHFRRHLLRKVREIVHLPTNSWLPAAKRGA